MSFNFREQMRYLAGLLLPPAYDSIGDRGRKRLFVLFLILICIPMIIFGVNHLVNGIYLYGIIDIAVALVLFGVIISLRFLKNGLVIYRLVIMMMIGLFFYWIKTGAVQGHASLWVLAFPLFSYFLTGRREGSLWTFVMFAATGFIFFNPFSMIHAWQYPFDYVFRHLIAFVVIIFFTYIYESISEKYNDEIENERRLLLREKEQLADLMKEVESVNAHLLDEMEVRRLAEEELRKHRDNLEGLVEERTGELHRKNIELEKSEKRYRLLAENINDMIWSVDLDLNVQYVSPSVQAMYGYTVEEALALSMKDIHTPESLKKIKKTYAGFAAMGRREGADAARNLVLQLEHRRKDGSEFDAETRISVIRDESGMPAGFIGVTRDISERVRAQREKEKIQQQLAQAQKMEAIGTLAGGLAHDFNNILSGILGALDLVRLMLKKEQLAERGKIESYLEMGIEASRRSVDIIKDLLALSMKQEPRLAPVDVNETVSRTCDICKNSFPKSVILDCVLSPDEPVIMGDKAQVRQVLLNLCINASHAMTIMRPPDEPQGGVISLRVELAGPGHPDGGPGEAGDGRTWVKISISDTGVGMDRETMDRIFEPFFTKKDREKGSGLGLAISYNIIQNHHGSIRVYSEHGRGARFTLYFPLSGELPERKDAHANGNELVRGSGTVLVIDDERMVLSVTKGFLEQCGYSVITAGVPEEGIALFRERHAEISAVIIDLSMQGMNGLDVFREMKRTDPGVRAILASGMLDDDSKARARTMGIRGFAHKPFRARELSIIVRGVLDEGR